MTISISDLEKYKCNFKNEYIEPSNKYNIFSFSVFYMTKYMRFYKNYSKDITQKRQNEFLYNLTLNIQNLERGYFGDNWYIRIFYDKSLFKYKVGNQKPWVEFITKYKTNKFVQFVQFRCEQFIDKKIHDSHINLFGTLSRLYPIFKKNDLLETIAVFDADNIITKDYFDEIIKFKHSKYDYNSFCSKYEFSYYKNNNAIDKDNCYIRCGMLSVNKKLPEELWNYILYQTKTFKDIEFSNLVNKLFNYHTKLMPEKKIKTYNDFEYGMDEIILNHYIKKFFERANYKMRVVRYKPMIMSIINTIIVYIEYYYNLAWKTKSHHAMLDSERVTVMKESGEKKIIINKFLKNILKDKYTGNLKKDLNSLNIIYYTKINFTSSYIQIKPYIDNLKNEIHLLKELNLPNVVLNYILNVNSTDYDNVKGFDSYFFSYSVPPYLK